MKDKIKQKGFIPIPVVIVITLFLIFIGGGVVLYETNQISPFNDKVNSFFASTSSAIYRLIWEKKFETEILKSELEFANIKKEQAEKEAEEETIARAEAEEKAQQEEIKRSQAEAKAKQEEFERKLKEQQLSEKEAEEKRMNADNDGDGLTYREELSKGTSDLNRDSDYDGINDREDSNPAGGGEYKPQYFEWEYDGTVWKWTHSIHEDWYNYYNNKPRSSHGLEYVTADDPFIQEIAEALKETAETENYHLTSFIVSFVQGLPYVADFYTNVADRPKYPVETFIDRNGDCEDFSYLSASLIKATGIGVVLVEFSDHMAVGIKMSPSAWTQQEGRYYGIWGNRYYYFETTGEGWNLGEMPSEYNYEQAKLIDTWSGGVVQAYSKYQEHPCEYISEYDVYWNGDDFYWDSNCSQLVVKGCKKSKTYSGKFYISGTAWYYDSKCTNLYKSMSCDYPSYWNYSCTSQSSYDLKKSNCDYYKSSTYLQDLAEGCDEELAQCRRDIEEYQRKLDEYNQCKDRKEY